MRITTISVVLLAACGGSSPKHVSVAQTEAASRKEPTTYDATGAQRFCEPPAVNCAKVIVNADFNDECRRSGYRVVRCGCEDLRTGNVAKVERFYDAAGVEKACAPEQPDCTPPETSAAFQDACTDAGHKLEVCGCEWLCNGPPAKGSRPPSD